MGVVFLLPTTFYLLPTGSDVDGRFGREAVGGFVFCAGVEVQEEEVRAGVAGEDVLVGIVYEGGGVEEKWSIEPGGGTAEIGDPLRVNLVVPAPFVHQLDQGVGVGIVLGCAGD